MSKAFQCDCCKQVQTYPPTVDKDLALELCHECLAMVHEIRTRLEYKLNEQWEKRTVQYGLGSLRAIDILRMIEFLYVNAKDEYDRMFKGKDVIGVKKYDL